MLKPGGRFLAVTSAAAYMPELWDAVAEAAELEIALRPLAGTGWGVADAFSEINGAAWVRETFGDMQLHFSDDALVFPGPQPVLAYLESVQTWLNLNDSQKLLTEAQRPCGAASGAEQQIHRRRVDSLQEARFPDRRALSTARLPFRNSASWREQRPVTTPARFLPRTRIRMGAGRSARLI